MSASSKLRMTRQRRVILEAVNKVHSHPTAEQVYAMVRRRLPRISLGTVYRNLDVLSSRGMIQRLEFGREQMRFDRELGSHCHVRCVRCGRVDDVRGEPGAILQDVSREAHGYDIIGHRVEFIGVCSGCKRKKRGTSSGH